MTKSTGVGRGHSSGGSRPGAGRKPGGAIAARKVQKAVEDISAAAAVDADPDAPQKASDLLALAFATLKDVMSSSETDAPRVTAARAVIEIAREEAGSASGKKAQRQAQAEGLASTSRFAPRQRPRAAATNH